MYLLDHEYTQRGLNWRPAQRRDAERAALLRAAAERAGCEAVLALAEVKETWDAWPSDEDPSDDYDYYEEEEEDGDHDDTYRDRGSNHDNYQLDDLVDDEISLGWWTSPDDVGGEPVSLYVPDSEVCATTPSADLTPYQSEYEGYMGNYGNTLDRWYRRAAVVVWPRDRAFAARAEAGSQWALSELRTRIETGDLEGARAAAESLAPLWKTIGSQAELLDTAMHVAAGLDAAGTAAMLLEPFQVETVGLEHAGGLAAAAGQYGEQWTRGVIDGWFGPKPTRNRQARVGGEAAAAVQGAACRRSSGSGAAAGRQRLALDERPAADLDHHRANRGSPATSGDAGLAAGAAAGGGRRRAAGRYRGGAARVRGHRAGVPNAGAAFGGRAADGRASGRWAGCGRAGLREAARRDHRAAVA